MLPSVYVFMFFHLFSAALVGAALFVVIDLFYQLLPESNTYHQSIYLAKNKKNNINMKHKYL